jgi:hypothetical protein
MAKTIVTLKNLHRVSAQTVFNQITEHMSKMKEPSMDKYGKCHYRVFYKNRLVKNKCAAGALIADSEYKPEFDYKEGDSSWRGLVREEYVSDAHKKLIEDCQIVHDNRKMEDWALELASVASKHGLKLKYFKV